MSYSPTALATRFWVGVLLAVVVAAGLRAWGINGHAFEVDEVHLVIQETADFWEVCQLQDYFPPLGHWVYAVWIDWFGDSSARWLSLLVGLGGVVAVALLGREAGGARVGVIAAWLTAISANHLFYSQQARAYCLYFLFATLTIFAAWRLRRKDSPRRWAAFAVAAWLTLATHYYAALLIALLFGMLLFELSPNGRRRAAVAAALFAVACLPLGYTLMIDIGRPSQSFSRIEFDREALAYTYFTLVSGFTLGPPLNALRDISATEGIRQMAPWAAAVLLSVGVLAWSCVRRLPTRETAWLAVLLIAPPLLIAAIGLWSPTGYSHRYVLWILAPLLVAMAAGADRLNGKPLVAFGTLSLVVLSLIAIGNRRFDQAYQIDDMHHVRRMIERDGATEPVLALPHYFAAAADYYLGDGRPVLRASVKPGMEQDWAEVLEALAAQTAPYSHCWIVSQSFPDNDPRRPVRNELIEQLDAKHLERVTWTIDVYRADADAVRRLAAAGYSGPASRDDKQTSNLGDIDSKIREADARESSTATKSTHNGGGDDDHAGDISSDRDAAAPRNASPRAVDLAGRRPE